MKTPSDKGHAGSILVHHHPYARLYRAVIHRAVQDLAQKQYRHQAREWLLSRESDHAFANAGISPRVLRQQMI